ncbi:MAG TPA: class I SAM-dependent methyltransferase [Solirubrobacteraceae bacterium]|nr:class I SAM-dependent methyltransferase [Solirubrobacteraceae bacterium]
MSRLQDPRVASVLDRLHLAAGSDDERAAAVPDPPAGQEPLTAAERADAADMLYMPISREAGVLAYSLIRASRPTLVVEFGTSMGISTIYLAAAVADNGAGRVVSTELSARKVIAAGQSLADAGLDAVVQILEGDARETLATIAEPVGILLLDGWKELYLPVLQLLEPWLPAGALVLADDSSFSSLQPYCTYVRDPGNGYESVSFPVEDGVEISCRTA